jgi:two-component system sensor histidine kinase VicK
MVIEAKQTDLRALIDESIEVLGPLAEAKEVGIVVCEPDKTPPLAIDRRRIGQVINNLLSNAIKFSPDKSAVRIAVASGAHGIEVTFSDSGRGIGPRELATLFQRYARVAGTNVAGTGLGLMIVREVIEAHGGSVNVISEVGQGSRFSFVLPKSLEVSISA